MKASIGQTKYIIWKMWLRHQSVLVVKLELNFKLLKIIIVIAQLNPSQWNVRVQKI